MKAFSPLLLICLLCASADARTRSLDRASASALAAAAERVHLRFEALSRRFARGPARIAVIDAFTSHKAIGQLRNDVIAIALVDERSAALRLYRTRPDAPLYFVAEQHAIAYQLRRDAGRHLPSEFEVQALGGSTWSLGGGVGVAHIAPARGDEHLMAGEFGLSVTQRFSRLLDWRGEVGALLTDPGRYPQWSASISTGVHLPVSWSVRPILRFGADALVGNPMKARDRGYFLGVKGRLAAQFDTAAGTLEVGAGYRRVIGEQFMLDQIGIADLGVRFVWPL